VGKDFVERVVEVANRYTKLKTCKLDREFVWRIAWVGVEFDIDSVNDACDKLRKPGAIEKPQPYLNAIMRKICEKNGEDWEKLKKLVPTAPRKRARSCKTKDGKTYVQMYTPKDDPVIAFKDTAKIAAKLALKRMSPLEGPIRIDVVFVMPRTQNQIWKTKPMPRIWHAKKPDFDNLEKSVCDALKGIVWIDDSQICMTSVIKVIASGDESPRVEFLCQTLPEEFLGAAS
jgi:Holliday junction resolvase RusA-like endonuclease